MLPKSQRRAYVGYDDGSKSVLYYNAETRKILTSRNYHFLTPELRKSPPEEIGIAPDAPHEGEEEGRMGSTARESRKRKADQMEETTSQNEPRKTRGIRTDYRYLSDPFPDEEEAFQAAEVTGEEPERIRTHTYALEIGDEYHSLREAKASLDWPEWEQAIKNELDQLDRMGTWRLVTPPTDAIPIANKWVFTKKRNKDGQLTKYKARLVAKGCAQRPGHDYVETHSPVVRLETIRVPLAIAQEKKLILQQMDVKGAYLNGTLKEKVYMRQPEGFEDGTDRVCLLEKTLYGLKQSGREWNIELDNKRRKHGYTRLRSDPCAYVRRHGGELAIITVWVDDLLLFATSETTMKGMKDDLHAEWQVTDLGEPSKIVGIEINRSNDYDSIIISQKLYIESILKREGMEKANPVGMPLDPNVTLEPNPDGNQGNRSNLYAQLLGALQFVANATRLDITYAVNRLASYTANPSLQHVTALKRILRYLSGTRTHGIKYSNIPNHSNPPFGFADAAYANADDRKSTSGYVFITGNGAVTWRSKKQTTVALSSTEAEYVSLSEAAREACWLRHLYAELGFPQSAPTLIKGDNDGSIAMAKNPQFHKRPKHIDIRWHWVRDPVQERHVRIESCQDRDQTADVLTKALPRPKHRQHTINGDGDGTRNDLKGSVRVRIPKS
jgi:reverse transcriptase-like protein